MQDNHVILLDTLGLNWKTTLVTHYFGTLEAPQHIYIQQKRPKSNKCSNSNFDMTCQESTYLTMSATYVFTPPDKPSKRGKLLETVADRYLPAPQIQNSEHRVSFMLLLLSLMSVSPSSNIQYLTMSATYVFTPPDKPRFKGAVSNVKGTPQQLWRKSEHGLDEDLYHCTWNSKMTDDKQSNTESEDMEILSAIILSIGKERVTLMEIYMML